MPGLNLAAGVVMALALAATSCMTQQSRIDPLAPDLARWITERDKTSCSSLAGRYRIAAGVQASLRTDKYRQALLHELAGSGRPPMRLDEATALSNRSATALEAELNRRCPDHRIREREDIVYVPQQF